MDAITCPCGGNAVYSSPHYYVPEGSTRPQCFACGALPVEGTRGAAAALPEFYGAPDASSADRARAYLVAALPALATLTRAGGCKGDADLAACLEEAGDGPVAPGWKVVRTSGWPHTSQYTSTLVRNGLPVASYGPNGCRIHDEAEERRLRAERRAKARANHDAYVRALIAVREVLAAAPVLRLAVATLYDCDPYSVDRMYGRAVEAAGHTSGWPAVPTDDPGRSAALALAWVGWGWAPGQEGGVLLTPGRVPVGVRGALGLRYRRGQH